MLTTYKWPFFGQIYSSVEEEYKLLLANCVGIEHANIYQNPISDLKYRSRMPLSNFPLCSIFDIYF